MAAVYRRAEMLLRESTSGRLASVVQQLQTMTSAAPVQMEILELVRQVFPMVELKVRRYSVAAAAMALAALA